MGSVFEFNRHNVFSKEQANQLLSLVYRITSDADAELKKITDQIKLYKEQGGSRNLEIASDLEGHAQIIITKWESKIIKLGLEPKGVWLVDFDSGSGYFCWKYPELELKFWHGYKDGFSNRQPIEGTKNIDECDPLH